MSCWVQRNFIKFVKRCLLDIHNHLDRLANSASVPSRHNNYVCLSQWRNSRNIMYPRLNRALVQIRDEVLHKQNWTVSRFLLNVWLKVSDVKASSRKLFFLNWISLNGNSVSTSVFFFFLSLSDAKRTQLLTFKHVSHFCRTYWPFKDPAPSTLTGVN